MPFRTHIRAPVGRACVDKSFQGREVAALRKIAGCTLSPYVRQHEGEFGRSRRDDIRLPGNDRLWLAAVTDMQRELDERREQIAAALEDLEINAAASLGAMRAMLRVREAIPRGARIIAVADVWDKLVPGIGDTPVAGARARDHDE